MIATTNQRCGLGDPGKQLAIQRLQHEHSINILFVVETNYDGTCKNQIRGCRAMSGVLYDTRNAPHYGTAVFIPDPQLAREVSLLHLDDSLISIGYQGVVFSGVYRKHAQDIIHFSEKLLQFDEMPHFILGDLNFNCFQPTQYRNNEIQSSQYINEIGFAVLPKDSTITRRAVAVGHTDSNIDHILIPQDYLSYCDNGTVIDLDPSLSDHSAIACTFRIPEVVPKLLSTKFRIKHFERDDKQHDYEELLSKRLYSEGVIDQMHNINSYEDYCQLVTDFQKEMKISLNETIGKHSPKSSIFNKFPDIFQFQNVHSLSFSQLKTIASTFKLQSISEWKNKLLSLTPQRQLKYLTSKVLGYTRNQSQNLYTTNINNYCQSLCRPMQKHSNISRTEIDNAFNSKIDTVPTVKESVVNEIVSKLSRNKAYAPGRIPNEALIFGGSVVVYVLKIIFQTAFSNGWVPSSFGHAYLIPAPKKPQSQGIEQCRPISLLCIIRKAAEIYALKISYFPIPKNQFGFQKNSSIHDALCHKTPINLMQSLLHQVSLKALLFHLFY